MQCMCRYSPKHCVATCNSYLPAGISTDLKRASHTGKCVKVVKRKIQFGQLDVMYEVKGKREGEGAGGGRIKTIFTVLNI